MRVIYLDTVTEKLLFVHHQAACLPSVGTRLKHRVWAGPDQGTRDTVYTVHSHGEWDVFQGEFTATVYLSQA